MPEPAKVGVFFGSRSVEHEVSVITAQQAMAAMPADRFVPVPVYIAKSGVWYTGDQLLQLERYKDIDRLLAASTRVTMRPDPGSRGELIELDGRRGLLGGSVAHSRAIRCRNAARARFERRGRHAAGPVRAGGTAVLRMRRRLGGGEHG